MNSPIYPVFGFVSALLESLPLVGIFFAISNQIGAAMWAHGRHQMSYAKHPSYFCRFGKETESLPRWNLATPASSHHQDGRRNDAQAPTSRYRIS